MVSYVDETSSLLTFEPQQEVVIVDVEPLLPLMSPSNAMSLMSPSFTSTRFKDEMPTDHKNMLQQSVDNPVVKDEFKKLLALVCPVAGTFILESLPGLMCIVLVGHMDSLATKQYVDAATLSTVFLNVTGLCVGFGLTSALDTLCSQANGAGCPMKMGIYLQAAMLVVGSMLLPLFVVNWHSGYFLTLVGQDEEVARLATEFSRYTVFGMPFLFLYEMFRKVLQAQSIVKPMVAIAVVNNIVNIGGGYYLTYHTSLGFHGAALSRTLGYMTLVLLLLPYLWITQIYRPWWPGWYFQEAKKQVGLVLKLGIPGMFMFAMQGWAYEVLAIMAGLLPDGVVSISTHAVLMNVAVMFYMPFVGISVSANIRVGNCLGANQPKTAQVVTRVSMAMACCLGLATSMTVLLFRSDIPGLIINDPKAIERAAQALLVMVPYEIVDGANCVIQGVYRGTGQQDIAAKINAIAFYVVGIPVAALTAFLARVGVVGLWLGFGSGLATALVICGVLLYRASWSKMAQNAQERIHKQ